MRRAATNGRNHPTRCHGEMVLHHASSPECGGFGFFFPVFLLGFLFEFLARLNPLQLGERLGEVLIHRLWESQVFSLVEGKLRPGLLLGGLVRNCHRRPV